MSKFKVTHDQLLAFMAWLLEEGYTAEWDDERGWLFSSPVPPFGQGTGI